MQNALHMHIIKENFESRRIRVLEFVHSMCTKC